MSPLGDPDTWQPGEFAGREFRHEDFSGRCLVGADFSGAVCKECDFSDCDLSMANFTGADLYESTFRGAIFYGTELGGANLTRADLQGAYVYGWLLSSSANISYTSLLDFRLENRRRSAVFDPVISEEWRTLRFGQLIGDVDDLCRSAYHVNSHYFSFRDLDRRESSLQRAHVYNRLKRLYRENHDGQAALKCHFLERQSLTRSRYSRSVLTAQINEDQPSFGRGRVALSYVAELVSGYGVRPRRVVSSLALLFLVFLGAAWLLVTESSDSGVIYQGADVVQGPDGSRKISTAAVDLTGGFPDVFRLIQYAALSLVNPELNQFTPYGWLVPLSFLYFSTSACLLAILFSSLFLTILSE